MEGAAPSSQMPVLNTSRCQQCTALKVAKSNLSVNNMSK